MKAKRRLKNFDFSGGNAAVALVATDIGGAANGYTTLVTKSSDVVVELSMAEFLNRFFNIWEGDAEFLARMLGYSDDTEGLYNLEGKVTLLNEIKDKIQSEPENGLRLVEDEPSGNPMPVRVEEEPTFPYWMADLSEYTAKELREIVKSLSSASGITISDLENASGDVPASEAEDVIKSSETSPKENEVNMSKQDVEQIEKATPESTQESVEMIEKSALESAVAEAIEKAKAEKEAELQEIMKGLQAQLEEFKAEKEAIEKSKFEALAKNYEVLGVEVEEMSVALRKMASDEDFKVVEKALEAALKVTKAVENGLGEVGHDLESDSEENGLRAVLKAAGKIKQ